MVAILIILENIDKCIKFAILYFVSPLNLQSFPVSPVNQSMQKATRHQTKEHNTNLVLKTIFDNESIGRAEIPESPADAHHCFRYRG